jgi:uncharacterized membrane protein
VALSSSPVPSAAGVQSRRVIFVDLARALAVVFMLYGHALDALLAPEYRTGTWFDVWRFQRGLTASLFLLLAGFAFSIATSRRWASHLAPSRTVLDRLRRYALFVLLGYGLHLPVGRIVELPGVTEEQWRSFLAVDVLQLIGVTFIGVQLLVLVARTRAVFTAAAFVLGAAIVVMTPDVRRIDWVATVPLWAASYLAPATGSLFPLFPWAAYTLFGAALGQIFVHWGASRLSAYANLVLLGPGAVLLAAGRLLRPYQVELFGPPPWSFVPLDVMVRAGACLLVIGAIAHGSRLITALPRLFGAVARETLVIYFVHLCLVYGSVWNPGLAWAFSRTLAPLPMLAVIVALIAAMVAMAVFWNGIKHRRPGQARWIAVGVGTLLVLRLV